jgi:glyoxylase-like metal-dependent hydrolase (beta-lactamase superfamily II)
MSNYTIRPLNVGHFPKVDKSTLTYMRGFGELIPVPIVMWAIEGERKRILIDTGSGAPQRALQYHRPMEQAEEEQPRFALKRIGWNTENVDWVILTHLHWDHCGNNHLFERTEFIVQEEEVRYAKSPLPTHAVAYETPLIGTSPLWVETVSQFKMIRGDQELIPGISLLHLPGHSPGFQGILVETSKGPYMIAGDCIPLYENWMGDGHEKHIPSGVHTDLFSYYQSFEKLEKIGATVLPGHDMHIFDKPVYP